MPSLTETKDLCYTINCVHSISEEIETTLFLIHSPKTRFRKDDDYRMLTKEAILKRPELQQIVQKYRHNIERSEQLALQYQENYQINPSFYEQYDVKCGLRDADGRGVLAGLTGISKVQATKLENGVQVPAEGELFYRGYSISDLVNGFIQQNRFGFEEIIYLLLTGELPKADELKAFHELLADYQNLPAHFKSSVIMRMPSDNIMNGMEKCVLALHSTDPKPDDISIPNVMRQCLELIARFPSLAVYNYQMTQYFHKGSSMVLRKPKPDKTIAENLLTMMRPDGKYTQLEARLLDLALVLHAEHGGGNNSTFTMHVVTSSGTDTYSAISASLGSLKGPKHGGANLKVMEMFQDLKAHVTDWNNRDAIRSYLTGLLNREGFDHSGLIYGLGHAVYTVSDPRARILKKFAEMLSNEKQMHDEFQLYQTVEEIATELLLERRKTNKGVCANVDFYSGFVYEMLGIPMELYTPIFAIARIAGWSAHRIEELTNSNKIIRPAYRPVGLERIYVPLGER